MLVGEYILLIGVFKIFLIFGKYGIWFLFFNLVLIGCDFCSVVGVIFWVVFFGEMFVYFLFKIKEFVVSWLVG